MASADIRWKQRLNNFRRAFSQLDEAVALMAQRELSKLEKQGVIQAFEYTYELGWNLLRDYLRWQGTVELTGSRDTVREAFSVGLVKEGETWMNMLQDRNRTSHTYNEATAESILANIYNSYFAAFKALEATMSQKALDHER